MSILNRRRPKTDLCGTPWVNFDQELKEKSILTCCQQSELIMLQLMIIKRDSLLKFYACNLAIIGLWLIVSKALERFIRIAAP